jgi:hypothetical protein
MKRPPTEWEKIFASYTSNKGLITKTYRELKKLNLIKNQWPNKEMDNWTKQNFSKEEVQMAKKTHEKMLTIPGHKGNANQNHTKIPSHSC